ncbi:MAG: alpha/beta fold hydrolase [Lachnospiraceae bacterium]|jgi:pimeloyl-ACP methyl ester carboxylesterase
MIDVKCKIELGGVKQKIRIRTLNENNPVLLFLHGGPGVCNRHTLMNKHKDLLDTFTVATWDQRGSGGSYYGVKKETLTIERITDDAHELVLYLCRRFNKEKIFIVGGSWGSLLGTWLAYRYPEHIAAYMGFGQFVNGTKNEEISYNFAIEKARAANDTKSVKALEKLGPPVNGCYKGGYDGMMVQRKIMMKYGGYSQDKAKRSYFSTMVIPMIFSGEYSIADLWGLARGHVFVLKEMWPQVGATDLTASCPEFEVPYFIFHGRFDQNTPAELVEDYFNTIKAPEKELIWFENSGHSPMNDEGEAFKSLLRQKLTAITEREACI